MVAPVPEQLRGEQPQTIEPPVGLDESRIKGNAATSSRVVEQLSQTAAVHAARRATGAGVAKNVPEQPNLRLLTPAEKHAFDRATDISGDYTNLDGNLLYDAVHTPPPPGPLQRFVSAVRQSLGGR